MVEERGLLTFRRRRVLRENLTAWLFLAPAGAIIFLFGIFPVTFSFFVSLHRWRRFPDEWRGLDSYIKALGNFGYVIFFWLSLCLLLAGLYALWRIRRASRDEPGGLVWLLPGVLGAGALLAFVNWFFSALAGCAERAGALARPGNDARAVHRRVLRQLPVPAGV